MFKMEKDVCFLYESSNYVGSLARFFTVSLFYVGVKFSIWNMKYGDFSGFKN